MRFNHISAIVLLVLVPVVFPQLTVAADPRTGDLKLEAHLIWGANDAKSPDPQHKPVDPEVAKKLKQSPLKWQHYFEVTRKQFVVPTAGSKKVAMSKDCEINVRNLGNSSVELSFFGKGQLVGKITQALPRGEMLVTGGNAANSTAWFVVLRQAD
jgi:hypothetical protein